jgi:hypothetical protein
MKCPKFYRLAIFILIALIAIIFEGSVIAQINHRARVISQLIISITTARLYNTQLLPTDMQLYLERLQ